MKRNIAKSAFITFIVFSLLYGIKFSFFPVAMSKIAFASLILIYVVYTSIIGRFAVSRYIVPFIAIFFLLAIYSFFITTINATGDTGFLSKILYLIYEPLLVGYLFAFYLTHIYKGDATDLIRILRNVGLIQAALTIPAYFNESIRNFYDAILPNVGNIKLENLTQRVRGFSNLGGAWMSSMLCISFICCLYEFENGKQKFLNILTMLLLLLSMIFTGRTGLMLSVLFLFIYIIRWIWIGRAKQTVGYIIIVLGIAVGTTLYFNPDITDNINESTLEWAFEAFNSDGEVGESRSGNALQKMIYMPQPVEKFILGAGHYSEGSFHFPRSDSGYMKTLLSIGLIGAIIFYGVYIFMFFRTLSNYFNINKKLIFSLVILIGTAFIIEIKEPYLQTLGYTFLIFVFFYLSGLETDKFNEPQI